jgi:hypothetical protein
MATYYARKTGNVNAADVWSTTPTGTASDLFPTFTSSDVLVANTFTVTLNVNTTVSAVRNDAVAGGTTGGFFILSSGVTLTANVYGNQTATSTNCVVFAAASPATAAIVGDIIAGSNNSAVENSGTGTLTVTSTTIGNGIGTNGNGVRNSSTGTINITASGGIYGGSANTTYGILNQSTGTVNITGNCFGGTGFLTPNGVNNTTTGVVTIVGSATGGTQSGVGAFNNGAGTMTVTRAIGNGFGAGSIGLSAVPGVAQANVNGVLVVRELEFGSLGQTPTSGPVRLLPNSVNVASFYTSTGTRKNLVDATSTGQMPAASNVRDGVSYASGALTGTCKVPAAASVAYGVPVDATTGTAYLSQSDVLAAVWGAATSSLTTAGSIGERLKNAATVASTGDQLASALTAP